MASVPFSDYTSMIVSAMFNVLTNCLAQSELISNSILVKEANSLSHALSKG